RGLIGNVYTYLHANNSNVTDKRNQDVWLGRDNGKRIAIFVLRCLKYNRDSVRSIDTLLKTKTVAIKRSLNRSNLDNRNRIRFLLYCKDGIAVRDNRTGNRVGERLSDGRIEALLKNILKLTRLRKCFVSSH